MKKIVYRKLTTDCIKFFLLSIFTISTIIWVLQAVNYLDFVIEDGHGFLVYFKFTLLSFPKILSRIYPFAIFLTFTYILLKYEEKNELIIFWNFGVKKISFINFFIKLSFWFVLLSLLLNAIIAPIAQNKARSFIRSSNLDFFESVFKPKKFITIIRNITIYFDKKEKNGELKSIFLKDRKSPKDSQTIFAKRGMLEVRGYEKVLVLYDGKTINYINGKISEFSFSKTDFNISKFGSTTTTHQKTQENSTLELIQCFHFLRNTKKDLNHVKKNKINNCKFENTQNINQVLYSRLIKPFYITLLISIALLFILKSKNDPSFKSYKLKVYTFGFLFIIFLESSSKFISTNLLKNFFVSVMPFILLFMMYFYFLKRLKTNKI